MLAGVLMGTESLSAARKLVAPTHPQAALASGSAQLSAHRAAPVSKLLAGNWTLEFHDSFNGTSLNTHKWGTRYPWGTQLNTGTSETQCYEPGALTEASGMLTIKATRRRATCQGSRGQVTEPYVSGMIQSRQSFTFTHGFAEIRAKLPGATSTWPAFWQVPADRHWPPALDVFEGWGQHGRNGHLTRVTQTNIWRGGQSRTEVTGKDFTFFWHTYGVAWRRHSVTFYLDGIATARYRHHVPARPMYVLADLAMQHGSKSAGPKSAKLRIDYIRIYRRS